MEEGAVVVFGSPDFGETGRIRFAAEGWVEMDIGGDGKRQQHGEDEEPFQDFQGKRMPTVFILTRNPLMKNIRI